MKTILALLLVCSSLLAAPVLKLSIIGNQVRIEFQSSTNKVYVVEESNDMIGWSAVTTNMNGTGGTLFSMQPRATRRFYRVMEK